MKWAKFQTKAQKSSQVHLIHGFGDPYRRAGDQCHILYINPSQYKKYIFINLYFLYLFIFLVSNPCCWKTSLVRMTACTYTFR